MADIADRVSEAVEQGKDSDAGSRLNTVIAALVAVAATFMALCNVKDSNIIQAMMQAQVDSVDTWAYYQAKSTKQNLAESMVDQLTVLRDTNPTLGAEARAVLDAKIKEHAERARRYETEREGIRANAEGLSARYARLNTRDDQFDMGEACLAVGIALLGITALTRKRWLLGVAGAFCVAGITLGLAGFIGWNLHPGWLARLLT